MGFSSSSNNRRHQFNEINITPLTDVFLVLLVIMILVAPLLDDQTSLKVNPPSATSSSNSKGIDKAKSILIEINKDGAIALNGEIIANAEDKTEGISEKLYQKILEKSGVSKDTPENEKPKIKLKADDLTTHGRVVSVYDAVAKAKENGLIGQLILVTVKPAVN